MTNTEIIYSALNNPDVECEDIKANCLICGKDIDEGMKSKDILAGNFTNWGECKDRTSTHICKECATAIKTRELRVNSFVVDKNKLNLLKKNDIEEYLFNLEKYVSDEFVVGITQTFKKHNSFRCKVNVSPECFYIREEDKEYIFDVNKLKPLYDKLNEAYLQFSKDEIQTGQYKMISIEQFGLDKFYEFEALFKQYRGSAQFNLLIYMMNSEKRNEYVQAKMKAEKEEKDKIKAFEKEQKLLEKQKSKPVKKIKENKKVDDTEIQISLF